MENASKALIIAGAILISILLISVGVLIMNSMDPMTDTAGRQGESMAAKTFNAQFTSYEGQGRQASQIRELFSAINASKASYPEHEVKIKADTISKNTYISTSAEIRNNTKYDVVLTYGTDGYVSEVAVTVAPKPTSGNNTV